MVNVMEALVRFATETRFEDLPEEVVHESKRILLDAVGCALGGLGSDKGEIAVGLAKRLSGPSEATIIGTGDRVSCYGAAFANGELIQALDYDGITYPAVHVIPFVLAAPLALAEYRRASGKELIRALAIAFEISVRFEKALPKVEQIVEGKSVPQPVTGYSWNIFGGTAASGLILGLDPAKMAHALGIAGVISPVNAYQKFVTTVPIAMPKHLMAGWVCGAEIISTLLADMGHLGDTTVFEGEYGYWRYIGSLKWVPEAITEELGKSWHFLVGTNYKLYPCCGILLTPLDCLTHIITQNDIKPREIEKITVYTNPLCAQPIWQNKEIRSPIDMQFSVAYNFSVAAHGIKPGPEWQELATRQNPSILELMKKITALPHPEYEKVCQGDANARAGKVEVVARGRTFREERRYYKGARSPENFRVKDNELAEKFRHQASRILPVSKVDRTVDNILNLERKENIAEVMKEVKT